MAAGESQAVATAFLSTKVIWQPSPPGRQVRLRKTDNTRSLTFKVGRGSHREEREIKLSPKQFAALWPGTAGRRLRKVRYEIPWEDLLIEVDIYLDDMTLLELRRWNSLMRQLPQIRSAIVVWARK